MELIIVKPPLEAGYREIQFCQSERACFKKATYSVKIGDRKLFLCDKHYEEMTTSKE